MIVKLESFRLKKEAVKLGLCDEWNKEWGSESTESLCQKMIDGVDFCLKHNYPSLDSLRKWKDKSFKYGIYTDLTGVVDSFRNRIILNGNCNLEYDVKEFEVIRLYVRHNSMIKLNIPSTAIVMIDLYDKAIVEINGEATVFKYGGEVKGSKCKIVNKKKNVI